MCGIVNGTEHNRLKEFIVTQRLREFVVVAAVKSSLGLSLWLCFFIQLFYCRSI